MEHLVGELDGAGFGVVRFLARRTAAANGQWLVFRQDVVQHLGEGGYARLGLWRR